MRNCCIIEVVFGGQSRYDGTVVFLRSLGSLTTDAVRQPCTHHMASCVLFHTLE